LTLMEVVLAMAILLMALAAIAPLIQMGGQRALDAQIQELALRRCESKLSELMAGSESLGGESDSTFPDDPDNIWHWSAQASQQGEVMNLWTVQVTVYRDLDGRKVEVSLSQMLMDPMYRGSAVNTGLPPLQGTAPTATTSSTSSTTTGSTSGTTGGMAP
jgi:type II secretory pathway pseudopilin PulG